MLYKSRLMNVLELIEEVNLKHKTDTAGLQRILTDMSDSSVNNFS